jgi:hypothetical protein
MAGYGQSLGNLFGQLAFGGKGGRDASQRGMLEGAQAANYDAQVTQHNANAKQSLAQALKAQAEAANEETKTGIIKGRAGHVDNVIAMESGYTLPQINAARDYITTGQKPMSSATGDAETDAMIGMPARPQVDTGMLQKLAPLFRKNLPYLTNVGDIDIEKAANADATYNTTGLVNRVASGGKQDDTVRALLAQKGNAEFDNLGGNGVFSKINAGQQLNAVGTSAATQNLAQAGASRASAANSYASAGQHNANTDKIRQEITTGGATAKTEGSTKGAPAGYRWRADGSVEPIPGGPAANKSGQTQTDAKDVLMLMDEVDKILPIATGSYAGVGVDTAASMLGASTKGAKATAQLKTLQGALIGKMPKMSGPQSDKDVMLYREMAGQVGDPTIPVPQRQAAAQMIRKLNEKYAKIEDGSSIQKAEVKGYFENNGMPAGFKVIR